VTGQVGHGSAIEWVTWVMGHVGHRSNVEWVTWVTGHGSAIEWVTLVMGHGHVGHRSDAEWVTWVTGQLLSGSHGSQIIGVSCDDVVSSCTVGLFQYVPARPHVRRLASCDDISLQNNSPHRNGETDCD